MIDGETYKCGQTVSFFAGAFGGSPSDVTGTPTAALKRKGYDAVVATFTVVQVAAAGDLPAGWVIKLSKEQTFALPPGEYVTDLRWMQGTEAGYSDTVEFELEPAITPP